MENSFGLLASGGPPPPGGSGGVELRRRRLLRQRGRWRRFGLGLLARPRLVGLRSSRIRAPEATPLSLELDAQAGELALDDADVALALVQPLPLRLRERLLRLGGSDGPREVALRRLGA